MKKIIIWSLIVALLLGIGVGAFLYFSKDEPTETPSVSTNATMADLEAAIAYIKTVYKNPSEKTPRDFQRIGNVPVNGQNIEVVWSVDVGEEHVKVVKGEDGMVTIDVNEQSAVDVKYVLTATVSNGTDTVSFSWNHLLPMVNNDMAAIVEEAYQLEVGASMDYEVTLTGVITRVNTAYDPSYGNITVTIEVAGAEGKPIECYRLKGDGVEDLQIGDTITVTGTLKNYNGKIEFDQGCILEAVVKGETVDTPDDVGQILKEAYALEDGKALPYVATLTGKITTINSVYNPAYGNVSVTIVVDGYADYPILCYRISGEGADSLLIGDTITVKGYICNYAGKIEFEQGSQLIAVEKTGTEIEAPTDIDEILNAAFGLADGESLPYKATLTGKITKVKTPYDPSYKNVTVAIKVNGKTIECYRLAGNGAEMIGVGDTVTVTGYLMNYHDTIQFAQGCTLDSWKDTGSDVPPADENISASTVTPEIVTSPKAGTAYKFFLYQKTLGKNLYLTGNMDGFYYETSADHTEAVDVFVEEVSGGYRLYFKKGGEKKYIEVLRQYSDSTGKYHNNVVFADKPTMTLKWNADIQSFTCVLDVDGTATTFYLGTYSSYQTMSASDISKITGENASTIGDTNFVAHLATLKETKVSAEEKAFEELKSAYPATSSATKVTESFTRRAYYTVEGKKIQIKWTTDNKNVKIVDNGNGTVTVKFTRGDEAVNFKLTATITGDETYTTSWDYTVPAKPSEDIPELPTKDGATITIEQALTYGADLADYTTVKYKVTGEIVKVYNTQFGNMYIKDAKGNVLTIYGTYNADGTVRYDEMDVKPVAGDTITVYGPLGQYNGVAQIKNGWIVEHIPGTGDEGENDKPEMTMQEIVDAAYDLAPGGMLLEDHTLTGIITSVDTPYSDQYGNVTVTIQVEGRENKPIKCYRLAGTGADKIDVGDTITVTGILKNYNGTIEFDQGCTLDSYVKGDPSDVPEKPTPTQPTTPSGGVLVPEVVTSPKTGKAYKFFLTQKNLGKTLYLTGEMNGYYFATTEAHTEAVDVYVETVSGGYRLYFKKGGEKTYIEMARVESNGSMHNNVIFTTTPTKTLKWNADIQSFTCELDVDGEKTNFYFGTYNSYNTFSASDVSRVTGDNAGALDTTNFVAHLATMKEVAVAPTEPTTPATNPTQAPTQKPTAAPTEPVPGTPVYGEAGKPSTGVAYKWAVDTGANEGVLAFIGTTANKDYYLSTSTTMTDGVDVFVESVTGGYRMYFMDGNTKTYIDIYQNGTYVNARLTTEPTAVYTWNTDFNTFVADIGGTPYYLGTYTSSSTGATYTTLSASKLSYMNADNVNITQFPARFYAQTGTVEPQPTTPAPETRPTTAPTQEPTTAPTEPTQAPTEEPTAAPTEPAQSGSAQITFDDKSKRTEYSSTIQVWEENGIVVTNEKSASITDVGDYAAPARFYQNSSLTVAYPGMTKIEFTCATYQNKDYATDLKNSITDATVTVDGTLVTVTFAEPVDTFVVADLVKQVRLNSLTVYTSGTSTEPTEPTEPTETTEPTEPTTEPTEPVVPGTMQEIVDAAYELENGAVMDGTHTLTGLVTRVNTPYDTSYQNVTVTITVEGREDKPIMCFRMKGEGAELIEVGDTITVTGTIKNYNGTIEFDAGCTLDSYVKGEGSDAPEMTMQEIVDAAYALGADQFLDGKTLTGVITEINSPYSEQYSNITVTIVVEGREDKPIECFRLKGEGADVIAVGDTITVTGNLTNYRGEKIEFESGCRLDSYVKAETPTDPTEPETQPTEEPTAAPTEPVKTPVTGTNLQLIPESSLEAFVGDYLNGDFDNLENQDPGEAAYLTNLEIGSAGWIGSASTDGVQAAVILLDEARMVGGVELIARTNDYLTKFEIQVNTTANGWVTVANVTEDPFDGCRSVMYTWDPVEANSIRVLCYAWSSNRPMLQEISVYEAKTGNLLQEVVPNSVTCPQSALLPETPVDNVIDGFRGNYTYDYFQTAATAAQLTFDLTKDGAASNVSRMIVYAFHNTKYAPASITLDLETADGWVNVYNDVAYTSGAGDTFILDFDQAYDATSARLTVNSTIAQELILTEVDFFGYVFEATPDVPVEPTEPVTPPTEEPTQAPTEEPTVAPTEPVTSTSKHYVMQDYKVDGELGGAACYRDLDETVRFDISAGWFTTQARIYKSANGVISSTTGITSITLNAGNKDSSFDVYVSEDGQAWTEYKMGVEFTVAYADITIDFATPVNYIKFDCPNAQLRIAEMDITFAGGSSEPVEPTEPETQPTEAPTTAPTEAPTQAPTQEPTVAPTEPAAPQEISAQITFDDKAKRTEYTTSKQVWEENGIVVTNDKASSTNNIGDYSNPARFYKGSKLTVAYPGMTKIEFYCATYQNNDYPGALKTSITGADVTVDGTTVTVTFAEPVDSFVIDTMSAQVRMNGLKVTATSGGTTEPTEPEQPTEPAPTTAPTEPATPGSMQEIVDAAYELATGASLSGTQTLTGVITRVNTPYDSQYKNVTVTITVDGREDKPIMCYRVKGDGADVIAVGDTVTVTGTITNYNGTIEFTSGCTLDSYTVGVAPEDPYAGYTMQQLVDAAYALEVGGYIDGKTLTGKITEINSAYDSSYKNITVTIVVEGREDKPIECYRMKGDGADVIAVGDTITVTGSLTNYNGKIEFNSGCQLVAVQAENGGEQDPSDINYVYGSASGYNNVIKNWGERGVVATGLSPNATAFYTDNNTSYAELAALTGSSTVSSVPGSALYSELQDLMTENHTKQTSYGDTRYLYCFTDCENNNSDTISCFYSGNDLDSAWDSGATWNREHCWPKSKTSAGTANNNSTGEVGDIMTLRPTTSNINSSRGNKAYGQSSSYYNPNGHSGGKYDLRGDVARIVLYTYVRWGNTSYMWGTSGVMESVDVLLDWIEADPVDTWELGRNDSVESITGTRNVFVDYPELAFVLFGEEVPTTMVTPSGAAA